MKEKFKYKGNNPFRLLINGKSTVIHTNEEINLDEVETKQIANHKNFFKVKSESKKKSEIVKEDE